MKKKCNICGEEVGRDMIQCPRCGRGVFESEKPQLDSSADTHTRTSHTAGIHTPKRGNESAQHPRMSIFNRLFGKKTPQQHTPSPQMNQHDGTEKVEDQDTLSKKGVEADQRIILNALASCDLTRVEDVLKKGCDVNVVLPAGFESVTPLVFAAGMLTRYPEFVETLLEYGADPNLSTREAKTALFTAAGLGSIEIAKMLIEKGAKINAGNLNRGFTALYNAVENGHHEMVKFLIERGANVNMQAESGWTPLHRAVINGDYSMVTLLIQRGANVNAKETYSDTTPLSQAIARNHNNIVEFLKKHGANSADGMLPVTVESLARNGVYCRTCDKRYTINQVIEPQVSNQKYIGFKCRKCLVYVIYDPEQDRCF